ncbi:MAG: helix-hairpin-helix domain-containing protein [Lachnospiraceae bacterium]
MQNIIGKLAVLLAVCCLVTGCGKESSLSASWEEEKQAGQDDTLDRTEGPNADEMTDDQEAEDTIFVQILGAVKNPGVYEVSQGSRLFQVLELAGGFTDEASPESVNQAAVVADEQQIYVYTVREMEKRKASGEAGDATGSGTMSEDGRININTAGKEQLMTLPGIGESKAERIVEYRESVGKFSSIEDVMKVDGIKEGVYNKIKEQITV